MLPNRGERVRAVVGAGIMMLRLCAKPNRLAPCEDAIIGAAARHKKAPPAKTSPQGRCWHWSAGDLDGRIASRITRDGRRFC